MLMLLLIINIVLCLFMPLLFIYGFNKGVESKSGQVLTMPVMPSIADIIKNDIEIETEPDAEGYTQQELSLMKNMFPPESK